MTFSFSGVNVWFAGGDRSIVRRTVRVKSLFAAGRADRLLRLSPDKRYCFTGCAFLLKSELGRGALFASGKAVWRWPPVVAVDAGAMQIQSWEGAALSRAETVLQSTTHDTVRAEIGYGEKVSQRLWSKKVEEGIGLTARQRDAERLEVIRGGERS